MSSTSPEKYSDLVKALQELLYDDEPDYANMPLAQIKERLAKENIDISAMVADVRLMVAKKKAQKRLATAAAKRETLEKLAELKKNIPRSGIKERLVSIFSDLNSSQPQLASAYFRKLEQVDEDDMAAILDDLLLLDQNDDELK